MVASATTSVQDAAAALQESAYATLGKRFEAFLLDSILAGLTAGLGARLLFGSLISPVDPLWDVMNALWGVRWLVSPLGVSATHPVYWAVVPAAFFVLYRFLVHVTCGRTLGKYIVGIEIVQEADKRLPRAVAMLLRDTVGFFVSSLTGGMGYWSSFRANGKNGKAFSDIISGTIVRQRKRN